MIRRMSPHPLRGSAFLCLTLLALADAGSAACLTCDAPAHSEDTGSILLQLRAAAQRGTIADPVQELPEDQATSAQSFCRFGSYLPYWAAIGERNGDVAVTCSNDFLCEKMKVNAQKTCGFEIKDVKCVSGVGYKDYKGLIDARNGTELTRDCGYESLGPGKVFTQSCHKRRGTMNRAACESRCTTWDDCVGYMTADGGKDCFVIGRKEGDCPAGYQHTGYQGNSLENDDNSESLAKIQSCYTRATAGHFLFFGHSFSCEDFEDYADKEDTSAAAEAALEAYKAASGSAA